MLIICLNDEKTEKAVLKKRQPTINITFEGLKNAVGCEWLTDFEEFSGYYEEMCYESLFGEYAISKRKHNMFGNKLARWYCPNCNELLAEILDKNGKTQKVCPKCRAVNNMEQNSRTRITLEVVGSR